MVLHDSHKTFVKIEGRNRKLYSRPFNISLRWQIYASSNSIIVFTSHLTHVSDDFHSTCLGYCFILLKQSGKTALVWAKKGGHAATVNILLE